MSSVWTARCNLKGRLESEEMMLMRFEARRRSRGAPTFTGQIGPFNRFERGAPRCLFC